MDSVLSLEDTGCDRQLMYDGTDNQALLAECMPQLSFGILQYDSTVPASIFSDSSQSEDEADSAESSSSWPSEVDTLVTTSSILDKCNNILTTSMANNNNNNMLLDLSPDLLNCDLNMANVGEEFPVINIEDADSLFEGIEANDMSTLLEQFETVAAVLEDTPEVGNVVTMSPVKPVKSQKTKESGTSTSKNVKPPSVVEKKHDPLEGLEMVQLLKKGKTDSRQTASAPSSPSSTPRPESISRYRIPKLKIKRTGSQTGDNTFTVTSTKNSSSLVTSSAPSSPQRYENDSSDKTTKPPSMRPNFYQAISDHDYCYRSPLPQYVDKNANEVTNVRSLLQKKNNGYNNNVNNNNKNRPPHRSNQGTSKPNQSGQNHRRHQPVPPRPLPPVNRKPDQRNQNVQRIQNVAQNAPSVLSQGQAPKPPQNLVKPTNDHPSSSVVSGSVPRVLNQKIVAPQIVQQVAAPQVVQQVSPPGVPVQKADTLSAGQNVNNPQTEDDGSVLKSLLLNNNIKEELARRTNEERKNYVIKKTIIEEMRKKANEQPEMDVKFEEEEINVVDMDISDGEEVMSDDRFDKFASEKPVEAPSEPMLEAMSEASSEVPIEVPMESMDVEESVADVLPPMAPVQSSVVEVPPRSPIHAPREPSYRKRTYRSNQDQKEREQKEREQREREREQKERSIIPANGEFFDKLPNYFTALTTPTQPIGKKPVLVSNTVPALDRDPSPERDGPVFDKMPAYFTCFTNSVKYDVNTKDPLGLEADIANCEQSKKCISAASSRSHSPNLVIASQQNSRANSVSRPNSISRQNSVSRNNSRSRPTSRRPSRSRSRSKSCSKSRSHRSSSSSSSSSSSCSSGYSRSRSRSSHRSSSRRSRSRRSRRPRRRRSYSYSSSSSRSRSRSRGRSRSYRSRSRSRSRSRMSRRNTSVERAKLKQRQIEQRRIVYVGRISKSCTRQMLRRQFARFGEIEEISVHFRDRGGDNYGFITFCYTCDAYAAIEKGNRVEGMEHYDLCFGGRREFCRTEYADLDGNAEVEEEMEPVVGRKKPSNDFDDMLRAATQRLKKPH